jgi:hypothetical protein
MPSEGGGVLFRQETEK